MTRVSCAMEDCDYNAEGFCMNLEIDLGCASCLDYEVTMND